MQFSGSYDGLYEGAEYPTLMVRQNGNLKRRGACIVLVVQPYNARCSRTPECNSVLGNAQFFARNALRSEISTPSNWISRTAKDS